MLKIREQQVEALRRAAEKVFETRMVAHLRQHFPGPCEALDHEGLRERIRFGIARARRHGFTSQKDHCRFVDLMFVLGDRFDEDPQLPWVSAILADATVAPNDTMRSLYGEARRRLSPPRRREQQPA
jgi:hypothetical protein